MGDINNIVDEYINAQTALRNLAVQNNDLMVEYFNFFSQDDKTIEDTMEDNKVMLDKGADVQRRGDDLKKKILTILKELIAAYQSENDTSVKNTVIDSYLLLHKTLRPTNESSDEDIKNNFTNLLEGKIKINAEENNSGNSRGGRRKSRSKKRSTRLQKKTRSRSRR